MTHDDSPAAQPASPGASALAAGHAAFAASRPAAAISAFVEALRLGACDDDLATALTLFRADGHEIDAALQALSELLDERGGDLDPAVRFVAELARFDLLDPATTDPDRRADAALSVLAAANSGEKAAWPALLAGGRMAELERSCWRPSHLLAALEQVTDAPVATGLPAMAIQRMTDLGIANAVDAALAREAERLLHAAGARDAAYLVESARKAHRASQPSQPVSKEPEHDLRGVVIAIAGGHISLRQRARADLTRGKAGAREIREIPSRMEANRTGRDVTATLAGCDLVILLVRYLAHSTADQVKAAAERTGTAVEVAETLSSGSIRRAVERWALRRG